jgi:intracellular sulfur oxidation DsrE/DsrF family protein
MKRFSIVVLTVLMCATTAQLAAASAPATDREALQGVRTGKAVFDINLSDPEKLPLYLQVIQETREGLIKQGVKPTLVVAFRGAAARLVSADRKSFSPEQAESLTEADELIMELTKQGVRFEMCAIATRLFKVDNATISPNITVVGNTFISLIGYQARGYAIIPIQ